MSDLATLNLLPSEKYARYHDTRTNTQHDVLAACRHYHHIDDTAEDANRQPDRLTVSEHREHKQIILQHSLLRAGFTSRQEAPDGTVTIQHFDVPRPFNPSGWRCHESYTLPCWAAQKKPDGTITGVKLSNDWTCYYGDLLFFAERWNGTVAMSDIEARQRFKAAEAQFEAA
jgi:hypothetical protein